MRSVPQFYLSGQGGLDVFLVQQPPLDAGLDSEKLDDPEVVFLAGAERAVCSAKTFAAVGGRKDLNVELGSCFGQPFPDLFVNRVVQTIFNLVDEHNLRGLSNDVA